MYQFVKPRESVELIFSTKPVIMMESLFLGIIISISIQKTKSIVLALIAILKLAIKVPGDTKAEITIPQFIIALLIFEKSLEWMKTCVKPVILRLDISAIVTRNVN